MRETYTLTIIRIEANTYAYIATKEIESNADFCGDELETEGNIINDIVIRELF